MGKIVSIEIGSENIHFVEGSYNKGEIYIDRAFMTQAPSSTSEEDRLKDTAALRDAIRKALDENRVTAKKAVVIIRSNLAVTKEFCLPIARDRRLLKMVGFEMEQYLPSCINDYIIRYVLVEDPGEDRGSRVRIRAAALPKAMTLAYYDMVKSLNLIPMGLDLQYNSLSKLFSEACAVNASGFSVSSIASFIDVGSKYTALNVINGGKLDFNCVLAVTAGPLPDLWIKELQKVFSFYSGNGRRKMINELYLHGGCSNKAGIADFVSRKLDIPVKKLSGIGCIKYAESGPLPGFEFYVSAFGGLVTG